MAIRKNLILIMLTTTFCFYGCLSKKSDHRNRTNEANHSANVEKNDLRLVVETTGQIVPDREVEIKCKASGEIIRLTVDVSDKVSSGDLLLQLDPEKEELLVQQNEVNLDISKARLRKAKLELKIAEEGLQNETKRALSTFNSIKVKTAETKAGLDRQIELNQQNLSAPENLERARTSSAQAESELIAAEARIAELKIREYQIHLKKEDVRIAEAQVKTNELSLSNAVERLNDTTVLAPIDGIVAERLVQTGQIIASGINNVGGGTRVLSLVDLSRVFVRAVVDESDIGKIRKNQHADISVDAFPGKNFKGIVRRVATKGTIEANVVSFEVRIEIISENKVDLKPQMTANLEILALEKKNVLLIPVQAVTRKRDKAFVAIASKSDTVENREIEIGESDGRVIEILNGLNEGEKVILPVVESKSRWSGKTKTRHRRNQVRSTKVGIRAMGRRSSK